jgi:hypothetical protein
MCVTRIRHGKCLGLLRCFAHDHVLQAVAAALRACCVCATCMTPDRDACLCSVLQASTGAT